MDDLQANDVALVQSIAAVPTIMRVIADSTGLRFVCVARVTEHSWTACAVLDSLGYELSPGSELILSSTLCDAVRTRQTPIVIDSVANSDLYRDHPTPRQYRFDSYFSIPLYWQDGRFFGTLCGLDPLPKDLSTDKVRDSLRLYAELISLQLETGKRMIATEGALMAEREAAEWREQFIAVLGHDLRTPLSSIINGAELIKLMAPAAKVSNVAERIGRSGYRIAHLVDDLMDFARGRLGGGIPLALISTTELGTQLQHAIAELESAHPGRTIHSRVELSCELVCDPGRLTQLLSNLLLNALTHGDPGQPIAVTALCDNGQLQLAVSNQGQPIAPATIERLFHPFWRGSDAVPGAGGLGLGLYIASQIARSHHGELSVVSSDAGTVFSFRMALPA